LRCACVHGGPQLAGQLFVAYCDSRSKAGCSLVAGCGHISPVNGGYSLCGSVRFVAGCFWDAVVWVVPGLGSWWFVVGFVHGPGGGGFSFVGGCFGCGFWVRWVPGGGCCAGVGTIFMVGYVVPWCCMCWLLWFWCGWLVGLRGSSVGSAGRRLDMCIQFCAGTWSAIFCAPGWSNVITFSIVSGVRLMGSWLRCMFPRCTIPRTLSGSMCLLGPLRFL